MQSEKVIGHLTRAVTVRLPGYSTLPEGTQVEFCRRGHNLIAEAYAYVTGVIVPGVKVRLPEPTEQIASFAVPMDEVVVDVDIGWHR